MKIMMEHQAVLQNILSFFPTRQPESISSRQKSRTPITAPSLPSLLPIKGMLPFSTLIIMTAPAIFCQGTGPVDGALCGKGAMIAGDIARVGQLSIGLA